MKQISILFLLIGLLFTAQYNVYAQMGPNTYKLHCRGCHGANLEGGTATTLIKDDWEYGRSRRLMMKNVRFGIPGTEMIGWKNSLKKEEIRAVVDFIIHSQRNPPEAMKPFPKTIKTQHYKLDVEVIDQENISTPWGIEFIDEKRALITEQSGSLRWLIDGKLDPKPITGLPQVHIFAGTLGGMMDLALDPEYDKNGWIYLSFSQTDEISGDRYSLAMTKIVRGKIKDYTWTSEETLFSAPDSIRVPLATRWGGRLLFDKEGFLYFSIGDLDVGIDSQDLTKANGKIFRIHSDGRTPTDNPFIEVAGALPQIFALGSRNAQGLAVHPQTGEIWFTEHGPRGRYELNLLKKGANYGWPLITHGKNYEGNNVSPDTAKERMEQPIMHWTPSIAACPIVFSSSKLFPVWKDHLLVGALEFEEIRRLDLQGNQTIAQKIILKNHGQIRDLKFGKDGALYVLVNKPDAILRIVPKK